MYVQSLSIKNLRSFESAELTLRHPGEKSRPAPAESASVPYLDNVTLLLGNNGAGKTTVLRAVALGALAPIIVSGSGYVPYALVRRVQDQEPAEALVSAKIILHPEDGYEKERKEEFQLKLATPGHGFTDRFLPSSRSRSLQEHMYDETSPGFLVVGYGATRRAESGSTSLESRSKSRVVRYQRVAGLFEEHLALTSLSAWLPPLRQRAPERYSEVVALLNQLLPADTRLLETLDEEAYPPECLFQRGGSVLPYPALSDGYRAFISWMGDLLSHLNATAPRKQKLVEMRGIVLVDEVDLHLHPEWQRHLIPTLSRTLPRLQFIFTSHSPLVAGTLSSRNILLVEEQEQKNGTKTTQVLAPDEELYGLSSDQILTSPTFGLESTRDERFFEKLKDAAADAREGGADEALRFMQLVAGGATAENPASKPKASPPSAPPARRKRGK